MANERITEKLFYNELENAKFINQKNIVIHSQDVRKNSRFYDIFDNASKKGTKNKGYPEFFIELKDYDINIVVECKYANKYHSTIKLNKQQKYAVDGAIWYSTFLRKRENSKTIAIGVSGFDKNNFKMDIYFYKNNKLIKIKQNQKKIPSPIDFYLIYANLEKTKKVEDFQKSAIEIHKKLHDASSMAWENCLIIPAILIGLNNKDFKNTYKNIDNQYTLAKSLIFSIKNELKDKKVETKKINSLITRIKFLESHVILREPKNHLRYFIDVLDQKVYKYMKKFVHDVYIDEIGHFYNEFLKYIGSGDGKGLGIVLTPYHICELFVELANITKKSRVIDIAAGTGGFLVASLSKMLSLDPTSKEKQEIRKNNLIGFENKSNIYSLLLSNMIIRNDGKSNAENISCFDYTSEEIKEKWRPNIGMMNPPYSINIKEWTFINHMLKALEPGSKGIVIIPTAICWNNENHGKRKEILNEHTLCGSFSMKHDLFGGTAGVNTNILIFEANKPHNYENNVYFSQWHDDGLKRKKGQIAWLDVDGKWPKIKKQWVYNFENKIENRFSINKKINKNISIKPEDYIRNDFEDFSLKSIEKKIESYVCFAVKHNFLSINKKFILKTNKIPKTLCIKLGKFFKFIKGKSINVNLRVSGEYAYVGASMNNNGISEYIKPIENMVIINGGTISVGSQGQTGAGTTFYQPKKYICSGTSIAAIPKKPISLKVGLYLSALIENNKFLFNYGNKVSIEILSKMLLPLPLKKGEIDFQTIENIVDSIPIAKYLPSSIEK